MYDYWKKNGASGHVFLSQFEKNTYCKFLLGFLAWLLPQNMLREVTQKHMGGLKRPPVFLSGVTFLFEGGNPARSLKTPTKVRTLVDV